MDNRRQQPFWIAGMALASFILTYSAVDRLRLPRDWFVLVHVVVTGALLATYAAKSRVSRSELIGSWRHGSGGALVTGAFMVLFVLKGPDSPQPAGASLAWAIAWLGLVYGTIDALLLSVFPVVATQRMVGTDAWTQGRLHASSLIALGVSLLLVATYHIGFPEFRGPAMTSALIGNGIMTLSYLATRSALSPLFAHLALHIAAVVYGYSSALPAPPHY